MANRENILTAMNRKYMEQGLPLNVFFELTYACNEVCSHCYLVNKPFVKAGERIPGKSPPHNELRTEEVKRILDELAEEGGFFLTFTGGDAFVRDDILELGHYAKKRRFVLRFFTNALLIDDAMIAELKEISPVEIGVSVYDVEADKHDAITKIVGSFNRTTENMKKLSEAGLKVAMKVPLMSQTAEKVPLFLRLAEKLAVQPKFDLTITADDSGGKATLCHRIDDQGNLCHLLQNKQLFPKEISKQPPSYERSAAIMCDAGKALVNISPFGDVFPCIQFRMYAGNLRRESFREIWFRSVALARMRSWTDKDFPVCHRCEYRNYCGKCPGISQLEDGDACGPSKRACELAKLRFEMAHEGEKSNAFFL